MTTNVEPVSEADRSPVQPTFASGFVDELEHAHAWRFGTLLLSEGPFGGPITPRSVVLVCSCGELRRVRVPDLER